MFGIDYMHSFPISGNGIMIAACFLLFFLNTLMSRLCSPETLSHPRWSTAGLVL